VARETYEAQVALLVRVLPHIADENVFALKGGTAINLFYRDLPRLSVDIDLTYLPIKERTESLDEINAAMDRIAASIEAGIRGAKSQRIQGGRRRGDSAAGAPRACRNQDRNLACDPWRRPRPGNPDRLGRCRGYLWLC
jgi:predicted nucleotidyltransferase component of viral defense system